MKSITELLKPCDVRRICTWSFHQAFTIRGVSIYFMFYPARKVYREREINGEAFSFNRKFLITHCYRQALRIVVLLNLGKQRSVVAPTMTNTWLWIAPYTCIIRSVNQKLFSFFSGFFRTEKFAVWILNKKSSRNEWNLKVLDCVKLWVVLRGMRWT